LAHSIVKKLDVNEYLLAHLTLIQSLHYLVKGRSSSLAVYNNEFILGSACVGSKSHWDHKIFEWKPVTLLHI